MRANSYMLEVSDLLAWGLNCNEIAKELKIHPVSVRRLKLQLKKSFEIYRQIESKKLRCEG